MNNEPAKGTFSCPRCEKPVNRGTNRCFSNLYRCGQCALFIQEGIGEHGVTDMQSWDLPPSMVITPKSITSDIPILKFVYKLALRVPIKTIEEIIAEILREKAQTTFGSTPFSLYVISQLNRLGIGTL